uniref:Core shell protein Gag P30 domain-containing protein n=1 Tax=Corvus moneduloides TaxID=1196302 RepID=A0A8U7NYM5_CORMO
MGTSQSKEIPQTSPLGCILTHWKELVGCGGTENKKILIKFCTQCTCSINQRCTHPNKVYPADSLEQELGDLFKPPPKREELTPTSPPTSFPRGPAPIPAPISPPTSISIPTPAYVPSPTPIKAITISTPAPAISTAESTPVLTSASTSFPTSPIPSWKKTPKALLLSSSDSEGEELLSPEGPVASRTQKQAKEIIQVPLREAVISEGKTMLVKIPFSTVDLEAWEKIAKRYRSDPIGVAKKFRFMVKQHRPDWLDIQLLLDALTETEKRLVLREAGIKDVLPLQDPQWDPNDDSDMERLEDYQDFIAKGLERAIPKTINWSALYAIKQGPSESPSEFLEHLQDAMHRHMTLDPESEEGAQHLVSLFLGQSTGDVRHKLQKIRGPTARDLETARRSTESF